MLKSNNFLRIFDLFNYCKKMKKALNKKSTVLDSFDEEDKKDKAPLKKKQPHVKVM